MTTALFSFFRVRADFSGAVKTTSKWLIPMLLTSGLTAYLSYFYNQRANTQLVFQQQRLSDLQHFRDSGAAVDQGLSSMSDALVDGTGLEVARHEMRAAIARHIADAVAVRHLLGERAADSYIHKLALLRQVVDAVTTIQTGRDLWQESLNLISNRRHLISNAEAGMRTA